MCVQIANFTVKTFWPHSRGRVCFDDSANVRVDRDNCEIGNLYARSSGFFVEVDGARTCGGVRGEGGFLRPRGVVG